MLIIVDIFNALEGSHMCHWSFGIFETDLLLRSAMPGGIVEPCQTEKSIFNSDRVVKTVGGGGFEIDTQIVGKTCMMKVIPYDSQTQAPENWKENLHNFLNVSYMTLLVPLFSFKWEALFRIVGSIPTLPK